MHRYWFFIGSFPIRTYSTIFVLAFVLGLGVTLYIAKAEGKQHLGQRILDMSPALFLGGILGARFWQVFFFDWAYYRANPAEIIAVWHGGLSIQGGVVGALLAAYWYARRQKLDFWALADLAAPGLILGQSIGRDANLMNGDAFGSPNPGGFGLVYPPGTLAHDTFPGQVLWPAEVWEGQMDVILFALLLVVKYRWGERLPQGWLFCLYAILYNVERIGLEGLRGDSPRFMLGWTAAQWTSAVIILGLLGVMLYLARRRPKAVEPVSDAGDEPRT